MISKEQQLLHLKNRLALLQSRPIKRNNLAVQKKIQRQIKKLEGNSA